MRKHIATYIVIVLSFVFLFNEKMFSHESPLILSDIKITIKSPLTISIKPSYNTQLVEWKHLEEVGIEQLKISFPDAPRVAHHVEPVFNGIFLTRVFNSWVKDEVIHNADIGYFFG